MAHIAGDQRGLMTRWQSASSEALQGSAVCCGVSCCHNSDHEAENSVAGGQHSRKQGMLRHWRRSSCVTRILCMRVPLILLHLLVWLAAFLQERHHWRASHGAAQQEPQVE
jgi:hypothetical protein